uniref:G-protein coupled receptors family 1 profile domain-containing protein n=1 Tax=Neogobius melanostomus TaxID=47308 RepID=A0A8C6WGZ5_9GOBI
PMILFDNSSLPPGWVWDEDLKQAAVVNNLIAVAFCLIINYVNATMVYTFLKHEMFKATPRYILFIHLVINDIILMTLLTLLHLLSYIVFTLNLSLCIVVVLLATAANYNSPMTLAVMSLECYIAVCYPLRHSQICTVKKTYIVIACIWLINALDLFPDVFISLATEPLEFFHSRVWCAKDRALRHSYTIAKDKIFDAVVMALVWLTLIYTYLRILFTAKSAAADARKARNTVLLHSFQLLLSMLTYVYYVILYPLQSMFPSSQRGIRFALTVIINIMPRIISPLVYGLRDKTFRKYLKQHVLCAKAIQ